MYTLLKPRPGHPYWRVRISLPGQRTREFSTKCKRKTDARAVADRLHGEAAASVARVTLLEALELMIGLRVRQKRSPETIGKLEEKGAQLVRFFGETQDVNALRLADTTRYVEHRRNQRVSDSTIAMEMGALRASLRYLRRLERYERDPEALWPDELPHGSGVRDRWLPWPEYLRVLAAMPAEFRDHFVVYCACGLRFSELYGIRAADLVETADGHELRVRGTKTAGAARTVPANPDALEALQRRAQATPGGPLFQVTRGTLKSQKTAWSRALKAACRAAGVAHASTNDLRRTFASWCFQNGVPEALAIKWLGHTSSAMVRRVYAHASSEQHAREVAKLPSRRAHRRATSATEKAASDDTGRTE